MGGFKLSRYGTRFIIIERVSYLLMVLPWAAGLLGERFLRYTPPGLVLKLSLSAAVFIFILLLRDVRRKIGALERLKQDLSLAAIHDLKGPLASIIGALELVEEQDVAPEVRDELLRMAAESSRAMGILVQLLVDIDRMEAAGIQLDRKLFEVKPLITALEGRLGPVAGKAGIKLTVAVSGDTPSVYADRDLLTRVFENLLMNAFKYTKRGGEVRISAGPQNGDFAFSISDTGAGIKPEDLKRVFQKYYRVSGQDENSRKGSGFGLYFCRLAIEAHGGVIHIDSKPGHGTSVDFRLPGPPKT